MIRQIIACGSPNFLNNIAGLFMADARPEVMSIAIGAQRLFSLTYITRWFSFAVQSYMLAIEKPVPAPVISVSTALVFPLILIVVLWPLGLTGIWLNLAGTSLLAGILSAVILLKYRAELSGLDARLKEWLDISSKKADAIRR